MAKKYEYIQYSYYPNDKVAVKDETIADIINKHRDVFKAEYVESIPIFNGGLTDRIILIFKRPI